MVFFHLRLCILATIIFNYSDLKSLRLAFEELYFASTVARDVDAQSGVYSSS